MPDLAKELATLIANATQEDLSDGGRYFSETFSDLTRCRHDEIGEYQRPTDGRLIEWLWNHRLAIQAALLSARDGNLEELPDDVAELVSRIGRAEWGATVEHDADGHGKHVADSVRLTATHFGQTEPQPMHGLYVEGTETVICHTGTSPNSPGVARALAGAWNYLCERAALQSPPATVEG